MCKIDDKFSESGFFFWLIVYKTKTQAGRQADKQTNDDGDEKSVRSIHFCDAFFWLLHFSVCDKRHDHTHIPPLFSHILMCTAHTRCLLCVCAHQHKVGEIPCVNIWSMGKVPTAPNNLNFDALFFLTFSVVIISKMTTTTTNRKNKTAAAAADNQQQSEDEFGGKKKIIRSTQHSMRACVRVCVAICY